MTGYVNGRSGGWAGAFVVGFVLTAALYLALGAVVALGRHLARRAAR